MSAPYYVLELEEPYLIPVLPPGEVDNPAQRLTLALLVAVLKRTPVRLFVRIFGRLEEVVGVVAERDLVARLESTYVLEIMGPPSPNIYLELAERLLDRLAGGDGDDGDRWKRGGE
jgi:hypothetical protein